jgi:HD-GYP domain-containing protein (c-di-GMP phosphodiesterase class II)
MTTQPLTHKIVRRVHKIIPHAGMAKARHHLKVTDAMKSRLEFLNSICDNTQLFSEQMPVFAVVNEMARYSLNSSAAALILLGEQTGGQIYKFTDCPLGTQFEEISSAEGLGFTKMAILNRKHYMVNDIDKFETHRQYKDEIDGVAARCIMCAPLVIEDKVIGAIEVFNKLDGSNYNDADLLMLAGLAKSAASTIANVRVNEKLLFSYKSTVQKLVSTADARETTEGKHSRRVAQYALTGAVQLNLSAEEQAVIEYAAILHDIGMLGIPQSIVRKKEALTKEDWAMIRKHPVLGYNLLRGIPSLNEVSKLILYHHERYDGKGYPCGLKGETIPIGAQLISVADAFDSMTISHSYRPASTTEQAMKELGKCAGTQFSPDAVKAFCMGFIKSRSLATVKAAARPETLIDGNVKAKKNDQTIWPISFNQSSTIKYVAPTLADLKD